LVLRSAIETTSHFAFGASVGVVHIYFDLKK
jgi:hypothetical protein